MALFVPQRSTTKPCFPTTGDKYVGYPEAKIALIENGEGETSTLLSSISSFKDLREAVTKLLPETHELKEHKEAMIRVPVVQYDPDTMPEYWNDLTDIFDVIGNYDQFLSALARYGQATVTVVQAAERLEQEAEEKEDPSLTARNALR